MDTRNPDSGELAALVGQISQAFGYASGEAGVERDFPQLYSSSNFRHLWVAVEKGAVAAHAGFFPSVMKVEGLPLPVAGIGGVYTSEAFRGKGVASSLIEKCASEALRGGAALAFLWSDRHEFYARAGFHLVGRQWTASFEPAHSKALRALGERKGILASSLVVSDSVVDENFLRQSFALLDSYPVGIARSYEEHAMYLGSGACRVISAWAGRELAGYFLIGKGRDLQGYVHEWAGAEGALAHLAAQCLEDFGVPIFLLSPQFMLDEVPFLYSLEEVGVPLRAEYLALVKLLSFERVRDLVHIYMTKLGLSPGDLSLERVGSGYQVCWRGREPLVLDEQGFMRLLFGPSLPEEEELRAFLPMRLWYWGMDSV